MSTLRLLIRPTLFTAGVCGACYCGTAIVEYENRKRNFRVIPNWTINVNKHRSDFGRKYNQIRQRINIWKNGLTTGEKIASCTILANFFVVCAWNVRKFTPFMMKYFQSQVSTTRIPLSPMILSCFSHAAPLHFCVNMFVVYSFSNLATNLMGPEQLVGLFIGAGAVSSLASLVCRLSTKSINPSLGASGAILGILGYICTVSPDTKLLLFFVPVDAGYAIKLMLLFDFVGLVARWRFIDHAAHLGGALFGIWYATYGEKLYMRHKKSVVDTWLQIKTSRG